MNGSQRVSIKTSTTLSLPSLKQRKISQQSPGRVQGFSRLINEKTVLLEVSELDRVINQFDVSLPSNDVEHRWHDDGVYALKFVSEAVSRRKQNEFHLLFEEPFLASHSHDLIFQPTHIHIYLTLKRPPSLKAVNISGGYPNIQVHSPPKPQDETMDTYEFIRSTKPRQKRYLCPAKTTRCVFQLLQQAVTEMKQRYRDMLKVTSLSLMESSSGIECSFQCKSDYLLYHMSEMRARNKTDPVKPPEESGDEADSKVGKKVDNSASREDSDGEEEEKSTEEEPHNQAMPDQVQDSEKLKLLHDTSVKERFIRIHIFPGFCMHAKDKVYFLGRPYSWGDVHGASEESIVWRMYYTYKENILLGYIFKADGHTRHIAWRILSELCTIEDELKPLNAEHIKQGILLCLEQQVDDKGRWQRETVARCLQDLFFILKDSLQHKSLAHYFIESMNIMESLSDVERSRAMVRCSVLGKSQNVLCNTLRRAIEWKAKETAKLKLFQIQDNLQKETNNKEIEYSPTLRRRSHWNRKESFKPTPTPSK